MALLSQPSAVTAAGAIGNKNRNSDDEGGAIADAETGTSHSSSGGYITVPDDGAIHVRVVPCNALSKSAYQIITPS